MLAGVIVLHLHKGDAKTAWSSYQDFLDVEEFSNSAEAMSAENLLDGFCSADASIVQQRLEQGRCWANLDAAVRRPCCAQASVTVHPCARCCSCRVPRGLQQTSNRHMSSCHGNSPALGLLLPTELSVCRPPRWPASCTLEATFMQRKQASRLRRLPG